MKKTLALLLALVMILGLVACAAKEPAADAPAADAPAADAPAADAPAADAPATDAPASDAPAADPHAEEVDLTLVLMDRSQNVGQDEILQLAADYAKEKLNINLSFNLITDSNDMGTIFATGEGWDLGYCNSGIFQNLAARNAFLDLAPYMEQGHLAYAQEMLTPEQLAAFQINGKQAGLAPYKDLMEGWNFMYNSTIIEDELGIAAPTEWQTFHDLVPFFYEVKEGLDAAGMDMVPGGPGTNLLSAWYQTDFLVGWYNEALAVTNIDGLPGYDDIDENTVYCPVFTDDFAELIKLRAQLVEDGIIYGYKTDSGDGRSFENGDWLWTSGMGLLEWQNPSELYDTKMVNQTKAFGYTAYVQAISVVVNANCEHPDRAVELLDMMYSDEYWCTLMRCGVEGLDWEDADNDGVIEWIGRSAAPANDDKFWRAWYGNGHAHSLATGKLDASVSDRDTFLAALDALNHDGIVSPHTGFTFDQTPVVNEITACTAIMNEYMQMLIYPLSMDDIDATIEECREKLLANGIETIIAEVQTQLDAYHAS